LNAIGTALHIGSLAVDPALIPLGTAVTIPNAPSPWNNRTFTADDTGGAIKGKHVDIYCGAGRVAEQETKRVTSNNGTVCF
jgi:3D (Asp-Asp-Asp) domain-containing protein